MGDREDVVVSVVIVVAKSRSVIMGCDGRDIILRVPWWVLGVWGVVVVVQRVWRASKQSKHAEMTTGDALRHCVT